MASDDRFYLLEFKNRPVLYGDIGSALRIQGLVVGGNGAQSILMLPGIEWDDTYSQVYSLSDAEWSDFIHRSDDPEILVGPAKIFQRKLRYEISGMIQQKIWAADGFQCMYCRKKMGEVGLTVDHFQPLELQGVNDETNYISACRACNKQKGNSDPKDFCSQTRFGPLLYEALKDHIKFRKL